MSIQRINHLLFISALRFEFIAPIYGFDPTVAVVAVNQPVIVNQPVVEDQAIAVIQLIIDVIAVAELPDANAVVPEANIVVPEANIVVDANANAILPADSSDLVRESDLNVSIIMPR